MRNSIGDITKNNKQLKDKQGSVIKTKHKLTQRCTSRQKKKLKKRLKIP